MRVVIFTVALLLGACGVSWAQGIDGALVVRLLSTGDYDGARNHLASASLPRIVHTLHRTHLEGLIARQKGRDADAASLFRAALAIDPDFAPARLELARTFIGMRNFEGAQHHFEILALHSSSDLRRTARSGLDFIIANRGYGASLHVSLAPSSNLNRGSAHQTFAAAGLVFAIDPDSRQTAGTGITFGGSAYNTFTLAEGQTVVASIGTDVTTDLENVGAKQITLDAGLTWQGKIGTARFALGPTADITYSAFEPHLLRYGLTGRLNIPAGGQNLVGLSFIALRQDYAIQTYRNGFRMLAKGHLTHAFTPALRASVNLGADIERTRAKHLDYNGVYGEIEVARDWQGGFSTSAFARYGRHQYLGDYPGVREPRIDDRLLAGVTVSNSQLDLGGFTPAVSYTYTRQISNVSFFDYDSHDLSVGLTKAF